MITKTNFQQVLKKLRFIQSDVIFSKHFEQHNCDIQVDFSKEIIIYPPEIDTGANTTTNFSQNENFVVLECVCRLLEKGYKPCDMELEPLWKLGHSGKSGRADIWVRTIDQDGAKKSLLIIECKTQGDEFNHAWETTLKDGAQLFSYFQQERATSFLCLYTSGFADGKIQTEYHLIKVKDNEKLLETLENPKSYAKAGNNKELFDVWKETYKKDFSSVGLFEDDMQAYNIGKKNYTARDLKEIDYASMQKKYHEFAKILRQHNVSGRENAFDKLVNLFLAKVVDEKENSKQLAFHWKGAAYDDYFSLQDRLQKLYKIGMEQFLSEDVIYIDNDDIYNAFYLFKNDPDATRDTVLKYFKQLKFFTNSDFSFIEVHNENLFRQNAVILLKVVQMLENIKLKTEEQNQFLGDLFEGFLNQGVKQSEGQFFTPQPLVRFIVSSLPLQTMINRTEQAPRVIDYACGAGHFLNEYAQQIKRFVEKKHLKKYYSAITGIEKEYRLSKVSKVAAFMYGQDDINIIYADALSRITGKKSVKDNSYSILVSNPPYSVKGFLETLNAADKKRFRLTEFVNDTVKNNAIETFFIERAAQLLCDEGIAALILPSSILSNGGMYIKCREIILCTFDIIAIAEFGSGTFGQTGTNTVTLFLRKKKTHPVLDDHYKNRIHSWFHNDTRKDIVFEDYHLFESYCTHIGVKPEDYKALFTYTADWKKVLGSYEIFKEYITEFSNDAKAKAIQKKKISGKYTKEMQSDELEKHIYYSVCQIEQEKLLFFCLAMTNGQEVAVIRSPAASKEMKAFLGYEWSGAKGNEGIKYLGITNEKEDDELAHNKGIQHIRTPLFNPSDLEDTAKLNTLIRTAFEKKPVIIPDNLKEFASLIPLHFMLDFNRVKFDKALKLTADKKIEIKSKYPLVKLGEIVSIIRGVTFDKKYQTQEKTKNIVLTADNITLEGQFEIIKEIFVSDMVSFDKEKQLKKNDCFMCFSSGSKQHVGKIAFIKENQSYYAGGFMGILRVFDKNLLPQFLYETLNTETMRDAIRSQSSGTNIQNLSNNIAEFQIPLPPLAIQQQIVAECEKVDEEYSVAQHTIEENKRNIEKMMSEVKGEIAQLKRIAPYTTNRIQFSAITLEDYISTDNMLQNCDGVCVYNGVPNIDSVIEYAENDILVSNIRPYLKKIWFSNKKGGCSPDVLVFRPISGINARYIYYAMKQNTFFEYIMKNVRGVKMPRGDKNHILNFSISVPSLEEQQRIVQEIENYETAITAAKSVLSACADKKKMILEKWL
ncbi:MULTISPECIES: N-6 DNA methylase [unclassified Treponema]|uniref:N-6 DNA methylase n=1 Tax=unclassified Treponema TaxID=2638727 RepID=UPI0020A40BCD|nr:MULTISPECIES: N-6 DNA methylase [unclassified Treponema]UTC66301.1 N-6 DNA methylase [Treponema sp. OMZ 789]UTC69031.1 N-6 DNA methylase [Treponema sp. OMZ 790]UTC71743.1 N-6 DNA methylase [Treponema sp. OMZ 791]